MTSNGFTDQTAPSAAPSTASGTAPSTAPDSAPSTAPGVAPSAAPDSAPSTALDASHNAGDTRGTALPAIAILGLGSMGGAILAGLLNPHVHIRGELTVTTSSAASAAAARRPGVQALSLEEHPDANLVAARAADVVLVAVKPWAVPALLREIAPALRPGAVVVSVAAGVPIARFVDALPPSVSVVRTMPNTPAIIGRAVTGVAALPSCPEAAVQVVCDLFGTVGQVVRVDETQIDALSTVSGSGPAYLFWFVEQLTEAARNLGFTAAQADVLVQETVAGAAELLRHTGEHPAVLRRRVTSPGGTTEQAIGVFERDTPPDLFTDALNAALRRAKELAE